MKFIVNFYKNSYPIIIQKGILDKVNQYCSYYSKILIVTDSGVPQSYIKHLQTILPSAYLCVLKKGEKHKDKQSVQTILQVLLKHEFSRHDLILGFGGGVVLDISAFVASIYKRGIDFASIPTTLLAQVDSCVGGKNGINYDSFKNVIGTFYHPKFILIDSSLLNTLPKRQWNNGLIETIKMGLIQDEELFHIISTQNVKENIDFIIYRCLKNKVQIVKEDLQDYKTRQILNFGHTVGHAIESYFHFRVYHGEAVAYGMLLETKQKEIKEELIKLYKKINLKKIPPFPLLSLESYFIQDKKRQKDKLILPQLIQIGKSELVEMSFSDFLKQIGDETNEQLF